MKVSEFMPREIRKKGQARHHTSYRAARRNIAKIDYRRTKRKYGNKVVNA